jgi:hypothetical protein
VTAPILYGCYFGAPSWDRLARVLEWTARRHNPGWAVEVERLHAAPDPRQTEAWSANTIKLNRWCDRVLAAADGDRLLLVDVDTMVLGPLDEAWAEDFDFAYTYRDVETTRYPFNAGVIFLRVSEQVRQFMGLWASTNERMLREPAYHRPFYRAYGGINQAALGALFEGQWPAKLGLRLKALRCSTWNAENLTWDQVDTSGATRIVHLKDGLRTAALAEGPATARVLDLARLWRRLEREAAA